VTPRTAGILLVGAVAGACLLSVLIGSGGGDRAAVFDVDHPFHAVYRARAERTLLAIAVGAALALAGVCLQGITRNPLADPGILGLNAGASLAMVIAVSAGTTRLRDQVWAAFVGAAVAAVAVWAIGSRGRAGASPLTLAVAGAAVTAAVTSWTYGLLLVDRPTIQAFRLWQVGTVGGRTVDVLQVGLPFLLVGAGSAIAGARTLDALALGDDLARGLGRRLTRDRAVIGVAAVLLAGTATALAGPIGFVGLIVPHAVRSLVGPGHRRLLPLSALGGALLLLLADTAGRVVLPPQELQVGIMTAVVGAPVLAALVRRSPGRVVR
jgi:iron complex transport system permease protein